MHYPTNTKKKAKNTRPPAPPRRPKKPAKPAGAAKKKKALAEPKPKPADLKIKAACAAATTKADELLYALLMEFVKLLRGTNDEIRGTSAYVQAKRITDHLKIKDPLEFPREPIEEYVDKVAAVLGARPAADRPIAQPASASMRATTPVVICSQIARL